MAENTEDKKDKPFLDPERLRYYRLKKASHKLKNRSSKDILRINHCNNLKSYKSLSNEALKQMSNNGDFEARVEIDRRNKKRAKKSAS